MKDSIPALYYFLILNILLVLLISISLSFSVFKHRNNLFLSTYELVVVVKSSRVVAFFIFHAIAIVIFFGSFKPFSDHDHYSHIPVSTPSNYQAHHDRHRDVKEEANGHDYDDDGDDFSSDDDSLNRGNISELGYDEDNDDDYGNDHFDDSSDEDYGYDDEEKCVDLQRRSEEFIAKNKKRWTEELRSERFLCIAAATEILTSSSS